MNSRQFRKILLSLLLPGILMGCNFIAPRPDQDSVSTAVAKTLTEYPILSSTATPLPPTLEPASTVTPETIPTFFPPAKRHPEELRVSFIGPDRNLYSWTASGGMFMILENKDTDELKISEDGSLVAFTRVKENQQSSLWIVNFDGSNPREIISWDELKSLANSPHSLGTGPYNLQWIPGTHLLSLSTREIFEGPGLAINDDLILVDADKGKWEIKLPPGQGGLATYSPNGKWMAISSADTISIVKTIANQVPINILEFEPVITYSEYRYYPTPQWAADGGRLIVVIPAADPLAEPRQPASVWTMDVLGGVPELLSEVFPTFIGPVSVSPDLENLFYVRELGQAADNKREIRTARINGQNEQWVYQGGNPIVWGWNTTSEVFAYQASRDSAVTISQINGSVGDLPGTKGTTWLEWVDGQNFLFIKANANNWELYAGKWREGSELIAALPKSDRYQMQVDFAR